MRKPTPSPIPGDIGTVGMVLALLLRKLLIARHCGNWLKPRTVAEHFWKWFMERFAGGHNVVMATGGGDQCPSAKNPTISWIHATSLTEAEIATIPSKRTWRQGEPLRLVTVGRLDPGKNTQTAIRALSQIRDTYPDVCLNVVGGGPCLHDLQQMTADLGLEEAVTFHGNVSHDHVLQILQQNDLFLFPTVMEGFPKAVLEAMACELPVVATAVSVLPHLIGDQNGMLLPEPTHQALAEAVIGLIADEEKMTSMSKSAQEASREYTLESWQVIIEERLTTSWGQPLHNSAT